MNRTFNPIIALTLVALLFAPLRLHAGPPLICHEVKIGEAKSLPWGKDAFTPDKGYDTKNLVNDTHDLLDDRMPVLVRMETLRRATLYIEKDQSKADALLGRLMTRALDSEAAETPNAFAWFDAGYLAQCYHQTGTRTSFGPAITKGVGASAIDGYAWVVKAISIAGSNPQMEIAAALMTVDSRAPEHEAHMRKALADGVTNDLPAAESLLGWIATINGTTLDALRAKYGLTDARGGR